MHNSLKYFAAVSVSSCTYSAGFIYLLLLKTTLTEKPQKYCKYYLSQYSKDELYSDGLLCFAWKEECIKNAYLDGVVPIISPLERSGGVSSSLIGWPSGCEFHSLAGLECDRVHALLFE